jgi:flagellar biosynthesis protein FlhG
MRDGGTARPGKRRKKGRKKSGGSRAKAAAAARPEARAPSGGRAPEDDVRLVTVGGGKGGVGKSFFSANVAASLAGQGHRVVVVDGDLEGANLHTCLGVPAPPASLADFAAGRETDLAKLAFDTPVPGLRLVAGTHANLATPQPSHQQRVALMAQLRRLDCDFVILDLGAGTASAVVDYFTDGDDEILVIQPEPTSVENAYSFLRAAFYRRMRLAMQSSEVRQLVSEAMDQKNERGIRTPLDLLREVEICGGADAARFVETMQEFHPRIVMNGVRSAEDIRVGFAVRSVCRKYFGIDAEYLGYVNQDEAVHRSVLARRPLVVHEPRCDAALYLGRIAQKLASELRARRRGPGAPAAGASPPPPAPGAPS